MKIENKEALLHDHQEEIWMKKERTERQRYDSNWCQREDIKSQYHQQLQQQEKAKIQ